MVIIILKEVVNMEDTNIWKAISNIRNKRRREYFLWKNDITLMKDYGAMTEDEFIEKCSKLHINPITDRKTFFYHLKMWESTPEYKRLMCLLKEDKFAMDLLDVYEQVKKKALQGDSQSIKNMVALQKEIKKYRKSIDELNEELEQEEAEEDKDDGLII